MKHTKGPWFYDHARDYIQSLDGGLVAIVRTGGELVKDKRTTQVYNGKLIAAAPGMLEALLAIKKLDLDTVNNEHENAMTLVCKAIKKAVGE